MSNLTKLKKYFLEGSAEKERKIRDEIFVETESFQKLLKKFEDNYIILKSPKGTGKSAIMEELSSRSLDNDVFSIPIVPRDLDTDKIASASSISAKEKEAEAQIIRHIASKFGEIYASEELPVSDEARNFYQLAVQEGAIKPQLLDRSISAVLEALPHGTKVKNILQILSPANFNHSALKTDIDNALKSKSGKLLLFIDDIDLAGVRNDRTIDYESSWAILSAAFNITCDFSDIAVIASVRNDVWHTMRQKKLGADKVDKISNIITIENTEQDMREIFYRRLYASLGFPGGRPRTSVLEAFFDGLITLPNGETRAFDNWVCKQSRERPRDLIQLVKLLVNKALETKTDKINNSHVWKVIKEFSDTRVSFIGEEFFTICPQIESICNRFREKHFTWSTKDNKKGIIDFLKAIPSSLSVTVDGQPIRPDDPNDAIKILRVLHMANFINPRVKDDTKPLGYDHLLFVHNENLITEQNLQVISNYEYEVHPVFHSLITERTKLY